MSPHRKWWNVCITLRKCHEGNINRSKNNSKFWCWEYNFESWDFPLHSLWFRSKGPDTSLTLQRILFYWNTALFGLEKLSQNDLFHPAFRTQKKLDHRLQFSFFLLFYPSLSLRVTLSAPLSVDHSMLFFFTVKCVFKGASSGLLLWGGGAETHKSMSHVGREGLWGFWLLYICSSYLPEQHSLSLSNKTYWNLKQSHPCTLQGKPFNYSLLQAHEWDQL